MEDEGIGIPAEQRAQLFEPFFRASNALDRPGTGLGLNIVKRYTELMGGQIAYAERQPFGSSFIVTLPYNKL